MHDLSVLITFAVGLAGAQLFRYIAVRLNVSPIIGYLLAGVAVGRSRRGWWWIAG